MFELSQDHEDFRAVVRDFAEREVAPNIAKWDAASYFPTDLVPKMGDLGLFGLVVPEEFGGSEGEDGSDFTSLCVAIEELGRVDQSIGITLSAGVGLGINPILTYGTQEQKERWLPDLVSGRALAGFGLTEPDAGSDAGATKTRAVLDGDEWVVDGAKAFITNSGTEITSVVTVTARTGTTADGKAEISAIMLPAGTPGFTVEPGYHKLGWHVSDTHGLSFDGARVPQDHLLGERGQGFRQFLKTLDDGRIAISALALGCAQACLELSTDYAKTRQAFGRPIGVNQGVSFQIADLAVMVEAARGLTYKAAWLKDEHAAGRRSVADVKHAAAVAKLYSTEAAVTATRIATQVFGGNGFMEEYPVARFYRDAKILEIGEGTSEVQRMLIARGLGLPA
ncbi:acyl-CoA dehydrogenase family protein [Terracoccus luteus]|jgi:short/branched chain acyl-CoA dehydrogenase|uniref:Alkylation response protein AidB-like acyl-CoA dehydrogenase n=1 Tax=Terracoccus luteus TaxID=53356 RepID=A0A495XZT9_9MICO|nr:acyl-CoA dehydrogenase family protein [Terracoccus luteus]MBB2985494.1 alkylation response protein AidB-like acyl-CoA dehydrogenase [Terracoccus luteus]MCP2171146.1 alkylation response protein AidB-like acyl-CoA dehydrogenase [Terracoccus luteus]RKT77248.1 alkylation response protein AidB-like acyl-CoA dehydrogenase [Terracoccus luteus]